MDKDKKFSILFIISMVMAVIITYITIILGKNANEIYFWGSIIALVLVILGNKLCYIKYKYSKETCHVG